MKPVLFRKILLRWHAANHRDLPWKNQSAYATWLSEVILQQTRVEQGLPYYLAFINKYPTVADLANAKENEVLKLWQGLGYYSRARNLLVTAKEVVLKHQGEFPANYSQLLELKGIGPYTAAAIASFAFDLPNAVLDGNVYRVLSRIFGVETPIDSAAGKKEFTALANQLLDVKDPASYNQAIMNYGAMVCTPANPHCTECPFQSYCIAAKSDLIKLLPIKEKKIKKRNRHFHFLVLHQNGEVLIQQRTDKDVWAMLFQFPLVETELDQSASVFMKNGLTEFMKEVKELKEPVFLFHSELVKQQLSHQTIHARFYHYKVKGKFKNFQRMNPSSFDKYAFPKLIANYLAEEPAIFYKSS